MFCSPPAEDSKVEPRGKLSIPWPKKSSPGLVQIHPGDRKIAFSHLLPPKAGNDLVLFCNSMKELIKH